MKLKTNKWDVASCLIWIFVIIYYVCFYEFLTGHSIKYREGGYGFERFFITYVPVILLIMWQFTLGLFKK